jgi:NitT/TauT family transport system permease protein
MFASVIVFGTCPVIVIAVANEIKSFPKELKHKSYTLGLSHFEVIWNVMFKAKLPQIIEIVKHQYGNAMVYLIAVELIVASSGVGYAIRVYMRKLDMTVVFPFLMILVLFGVIFKLSLVLLRKVLCPWYNRRR